MSVVLLLFLTASTVAVTSQGLESVARPTRANRTEQHPGEIITAKPAPHLPQGGLERNTERRARKNQAPNNGTTGTDVGKTRDPVAAGEGDHSEWWEGRPIGHLYRGSIFPLLLSFQFFITIASLLFLVWSTGRTPVDIDEALGGLPGMVRRI